MLIFFILFL